MNTENRTRVFVAAAAAFLLFLLAIAQALGEPTPARSWRDAPDSTQYGPKTGVVWIDREDVLNGTEGATYHRGLCPAKPADAVPYARRAASSHRPCPTCEPESK